MNVAATRKGGMDLQTIKRELPGALNRLHEKYRKLKAGRVADFLPELAQSNPDWFGICAVTADGDCFEAGDVSVRFTLQSAAKPFVYALALEDRGRDEVARRIGVEPTGSPFNSIVQQEEILEGTINPMVNAGAIATSSLIEGANQTERFWRILEKFRRCVGRDLFVDQTVFSSKRHTDHMNRALAHLMMASGRIEGSVEDALDLYFKQCSLMADCRDLAVMAATLANAGVNPVTGETGVKPEYIKDILSVMYMCGMYDYSGQWAYRIGLPAKSGLAGAILAVVPGKMGIAVFSPPLGTNHKSVRGARVCEDLSRRFRLHVFNRLEGDFEGGQQTGALHGPMTRDARLASLASQNTANGSKERPGPMIARRNPRTPFYDLLASLRERFLEEKEGLCYTGARPVHHVDPDWFGICAVTVDGASYEIGDSDIPFLIQSISKVFVYGMALEDHGRDYVLTRVDVEPTGKAYNSVIRVQENTKRPHNPMVNAGAIATTSLIKGEWPAQRLSRILEMYRRYTGRQVYIDMPSYVSEQNGGDRNWSISYLLRSFGMIEGEIVQTLDLYLQQCSAIITCRDLAVMGAALANNGVNPVTGERAIDGKYVRDLLSVMYTCGMYDFAGKWVYNIGYPAKSGVGGGILLVVPGQCGIAVFSPPLDKRGNSVRGIKVFEELFRRMRCHLFDPFSKGYITGL